jgi:hypothetical protein
MVPESPHDDWMGGNVRTAHRTTVEVLARFVVGEGLRRPVLVAVGRWGVLSLPTTRKQTFRACRLCTRPGTSGTPRDPRSPTSIGALRCFAGLHSPARGGG